MAQRKQRWVWGNIVDVISKDIYPGCLKIRDGYIQKIYRLGNRPYLGRYIIPGFIDAHVHIESSLLVPSEFARIAVRHGTIAAVSDPHEIANVLGVDGVYYMIENGKQVPFKFYFGAPCCVPATCFETSGAVIGIPEMEELLSNDDILSMSEVMNYPGVIYKDPDIWAKINLAHSRGKIIDGHAPLLRGKDLQTYFEAGITTDHESVSLDEALEKIDCGMKILIREGSAAKNFEELAGLIDLYPDLVMFCSDDKHPDDLVKGHINDLVRRSVERGLDLMNVLRAASLNPVRHYGLDIGLLQRGDPADFLIVNNLKEFKIIAAFIKGQPVARCDKSLIESVPFDTPNNFGVTEHIRPEDLAVLAEGPCIQAIGVMDGQIVTDCMKAATKEVEGYAVPDVENDVLKIAVVNRYSKASPTVGFVTGFGLDEGAIASSVSHDSHNLVAVGTSDKAIADVLNLIIDNRGGMAAVDGSGSRMVIPLPVAGIMSHRDGLTVAEQYAALDAMSKKMGATLQAPYMTLSFMSLLVIPHLKIGDIGLFDGDTFSFTGLFVEKEA
ncbi:MAG: adenine deaminase [bacterium]